MARGCHKIPSGIDCFYDKYLA